MHRPLKLLLAATLTAGSFFASPDSTHAAERDRILYSTSEGVKELGTGRLLFSGALGFEPPVIAQSADGARLAATSPSGVRFPGAVALMGADGACPVVLRNGGGSALSWAPDGVRLALDSAILDTGTPGAEPVYPSEPVGGDPDWFPSERVDHIAYSQSRYVDGAGEFDVVRLDLKTRQVTTLVGGPTLDGFPKYSPDGTKLAFLRFSGSSLSSRPESLYVANADGSNPRLVTTLNDIRTPSWNRDGTHILLANEGTEAQRGIYRVNVTTGATERLAPEGSSPIDAPLRDRDGYLTVTSTGQSYGFGASCSAPAGPLGPVVAAASNPARPGHWQVDAAGRVRALGAAAHLGDLNGRRLNQPVVGVAATADGGGYWLIARDGGIFSFGTAAFHGSTGAIRLNQPIVGGASTPTGKGYWLVASDGGIFSFGDARFHGSTGAIRLNQPVVGMRPTPSGNGYWLVARDGGIFSFGDAAFYGSTGAIRLNQPIVGMAATPDNRGYRLVAADGGVFTFGTARYLGSTGGIRTPGPTVALLTETIPGG